MKGSARKNAKFITVMEVDGPVTGQVTHSAGRVPRV